MSKHDVRQMKAGHHVMSISRQGGGLSEAVRHIARSLSERDVGVDVFALRDCESDRDLENWRGLNVHLFQTQGPRGLGYARSMASEIAKVDADLQHCHGLWLYASLAVLRWHKRTGKPYLISPHGMLESRVELQKSRLKKRIALALYQSAHLKNAACIHALCEPEAMDIRAFGLKNPIAIVPNGVNLPDVSTAKPPAPWGGKIEAGRKVLLYLGRINPKKGLRHLVGAVELMSAEGIWPSNWVVAIAGWDQDGHQQELEARIAGKSATRNIVFVGPLYGSDKDAAYRNSDAFILPSESEGLPLTVIEAWSYGLPVVMTPECNIPQGFEGKAAIRMEANPGDAVSALKALFSMSDQERIAIGSRGLALVKERFTWSRVAAQMHAVYSWVVNGGDAPDSVIRN